MHYSYISHFLPRNLYKSAQESVEICTTDLAVIPATGAAGVQPIQDGQGKEASSKKDWSSDRRHDDWKEASSEKDWSGDGKHDTWKAWPSCDSLWNELPVSDSLRLSWNVGHTFPGLGLSGRVRLVVISDFSLSIIREHHRDPIALPHRAMEKPPIPRPRVELSSDDMHVHERAQTLRLVLVQPTIMRISSPLTLDLE